MANEDNMSWLTDGPVDYELKHYRMLAILSRLRKDLKEHKVWPVIEYVENQLDSLYRIKYEIEVKDEQLRVPKDIDFINFEIIYEDLQTDDALNHRIVDDIVVEAIVELGDVYMDAREIWRKVESSIRLTWIPKKQSLLNAGYMIIPYNESIYTFYFDKPTKMSNSWRQIQLKNIEVFENNQENIVKFYDQYQNENETLMFCRLGIAFKDIPFEDAILPVAKAVLFNALVRDFA